MENCKCYDIIMGDDSDAFGQGDFMEIEWEVPAGQIVTKLEFYCGDIYKEWENPVSPLGIDLTSAETRKLKICNTGSLIFYDGQGKQLTVPCVIEFTAKEGVK